MLGTVVGLRSRFQQVIILAIGEGWTPANGLVSLVLLDGTEAWNGVDGLLQHGFEDDGSQLSLRIAHLVVVGSVLVPKNHILDIRLVVRRINDIGGQPFEEFTGIDEGNIGSAVVQAKVSNDTTAVHVVTVTSDNGHPFMSKDDVDEDHVHPHISLEERINILRRRDVLGVKKDPKLLGKRDGLELEKPIVVLLIAFQLGIVVLVGSDLENRRCRRGR